MRTGTPRRDVTSPASSRMEAGSSSGALFVTTARRATASRPAWSSARPDHKSRHPRHTAVRNRSTTGAAASTTSTWRGAPSGSTPLTSRGRVVGGPAVVGMGRSRRRMSAGGSVTTLRSRRLGRRAGLLGLVVGDLDDAAPVATPPAHHVVDVTGQHLFVFDLELTAHREVVKRLRRLRDRNVEAGEVAAGVAAVSRQAHAVNGSP